MENMSQELELGIPKKAQKGQGIRNLECDRYSACLDHAANQNWPGFDCQGCSWALKQAREPEPKVVEPPPVLCADCGERERMGSSPYCPRCMAIRGNKARAKNKDPEKPKKAKDTQGQAKAKTQAREGNTALRIEFGRHVGILRKIEDLAEKEIRPVECQVIYMLKRQLDALEANCAQSGTK